MRFYLVVLSTLVILLAPLGFGQDVPVKAPPEKTPPAKAAPAKVAATGKPAQTVQFNVALFEYSRSKLEAADARLYGGRRGDNAMELLENQVRNDRVALGGSKAQKKLIKLIKELRKDHLLIPLSEPLIEANLGRPSTMHVGGEIGFPDKDDQGKETTTFRDYGIKLSFEAKLASKNQLQVSYEATIIDLEPQPKSLLSWFDADPAAPPGITTRSMASTMEVASGQTFVAFLGDVTDHQADSHEANEHIILITPTLLRGDVSNNAAEPTR